MVTQLASDTGAASQTYVSYLAERARGGVGLIVVEASYVDPLGKAFACQLSLDRDALVPSHVELTEAVHRFGAKIAVQLHHGGNRADPRFTGGRLVAPSPIAGGSVTPDELTERDIASLVQRFGEAAERARRAGYDAVEIHGAHGYLLHQFLSPATNRRTDAYGGSTQNRLRFTLEVIRSVRQAVGPDFPVLYRLSAEGGYGLEEAVVFAREWEAAGVNALHVSVGGTAPITLVPPETSPMALPQGYIVDYAHAINNAVSIPVIAVGEIREPVFAEEVLAHGKADFIALGRPLLCDPFWAAKAAQGREEDILKCMSCDHCRRALRWGTPIRCLINPRLGREGWLQEPTPAPAARKVMVVGSGPAGMEAARVAALRGHRVSLHEAEPTLGGGQLALTYVPPFKEKLAWLTDYLRRQVAALPIEVHLNSSVDATTVEREAPDVLVVATGAVPLIPDIPGIDGDNVVTAHEILKGKALPPGSQVVVLGGRQVGCETSEYLVQQGHRVTLVARSPASQLADDAPYTYRAALLKRLDKAGIECLVEHDVEEIRRDGLVLRGPGNTKRFLPANVVVIARGAVPQRSLADEVEERIEEVYVIGDSQEPRSIAEAMYEGTLIGRQI
jgi:2,4-dienoyl-CoA reductase-like NADH-dependent reductase (Old Yellow Enzyme family)/thioredoxin reductase